MKKLLKKVKSKKGFTLIEALATIIVLLLVTEIITLTVSMSAKYFNKSTQESEAQTLCASLASSVQEELEYATRIQGSDASYTYYSRARAHGSGCSIQNVDGRVVVDKNGVAYPLIGSKAYPFNTVASATVTWDSTEKEFSVEVSVFESASETTPIATQAFTVTPVNKGA